MPDLDHRNVNALWSSVLVETLARRGLRHAVISPGSRSTPLTVQFARHPQIEAIPVLDERSAGFFALGLARQANRPVVLLCTSGTAGANYYPAVIEARESGVPLIVITADRPPEMRECRSGQTIDQQKLFGSYVNFYHEFALPAAEMGLLRYVRQTTAHAWERALFPCGGPVHLNAPFRDPLPPVTDDQACVLEGRIGPEFFAHLDPAEPSTVRLAKGALRAMASTVIVAGQTRVSDAKAYVRRVALLARKLGAPVLADALSPLRNFAREIPTLITRYDVIARSESMREKLAPAQVVCLHDWPTSKALRQWLQALDVPTTFITSRLDHPDALHGATRVVRAEIDDLARQVVGKAPAPAWVQRWCEADRVAKAHLATRLKPTDYLFEGRICAVLPKLLARGSTVMVANSMPVRDAEYFWPANDRAHEVHCNRGANGIDGTLSTAVGLAHGSGRPTLLLTGDLAFLHDTNGLLLAKELRGRLTVIVVNNDGGGIFEHLPVAQFEPPFERFFGTPQGVDLASLCRAYGVKHEQPGGWAEFESAVQAAATRAGVNVIELRTDRRRDAAWRKALFAEAAAKLK